MDERFTTIAAIDIGTSKVSCAIAHIGGDDGSISVIGKGTSANTGMRKGVVTDIEKTGAAIKAAVDAAERLSGYHIEHAVITVSGSHVEGQNSSGQVAVANPDREIRDDDVDRVLEVCRAIQVPGSRMLLHVLPSSYIVDGQEGIQQPRGMVAYRLEARAHLITAGARNLDRAADLKDAINIVVADLTVRVCYRNLAARVLPLNVAPGYGDCRMFNVIAGESLGGINRRPDCSTRLLNIGDDPLPHPSVCGGSLSNDRDGAVVAADVGNGAAHLGGADIDRGNRRESLIHRYALPFWMPSLVHRS